LPGITKRHVVDLCTRNNIAMIEQRISEAELFELDELFLTGTTIQVVPIIALDEKPVGTGKVGPVVKQVQEAFNQSVKDWLSKAAV
jgi:D-alanine transaminase